MAVVEHKKIQNVRYLFGSPSTVKSRYNQLKRTFPEGKEYFIFAEPVFVEDTNTIIWSTEYDGNIVNYSKLSPTDQVTAQKLLTKSIQNILAAAKDFETDDLTEFVYNCIEIPSMNNVFLVRGKGEDKVVLTEWGFVSDEPGMEKGLLAKIINVKRIPMTFLVQYPDKEPAPNQKFFFEFEGHTEPHISDINGKIVVDDVKIDEKVKVYRKENDEIIDEQEFICYEGGKYTLVVDRKIDMPFTVLDDANNPVAGVSFTFDYAGNSKTLTSDAQGKITLPQVKQGTEVEAYIRKEDEKKAVHNFICEKDKEYVLKIKSDAPKSAEKYNMRFKVIDPNGEIVPDAKIKVKYNGLTKELTTDENGYAVLEDVEPGTQIKVVAKGKKQKKNKEKQPQKQET